MIRSRNVKLTIAGHHWSRCWHSHGVSPIHEAKIGPSVEHEEVDGHIHFKDFCYYGYHVCFKWGKHTQTDPV